MVAPPARSNTRMTAVICLVRPSVHNLLVPPLPAFISFNQQRRSSNIAIGRCSAPKCRTTRHRRSQIAAHQIANKQFKLDFQPSGPRSTIFPRPNKHPDWRWARLVLTLIDRYANVRSNAVIEIRHGVRSKAHLGSFTHTGQVEATASPA